MIAALALPRLSGLTVVSAWRRPLATLTAAWLLVLAVFHRDVVDLTGIWWNDSSFGHCLFVLPLIAWLVWARRAPLAALSPKPWWPGLLLVAGAGGLWLVGWAGGLAILRHAALVGMLAACVPALLGGHVARGLAFPIFYAVFLIPAGDELVQPLQTLTAAMATGLLAIAGVPFSVDGVLIRIPGGWFEVAEACAGANFVIAMTAYAALAAHVGFSRWRDRALFMAFAIAMPILANGLRAFATIWIAWATDVNVAAGVDHVVYGWFFFAVVVALVVAAAWRFFDWPIDRPAFDPARLRPDSARALRRPVAFAMVAALVLGPAAWAMQMDGRSATLPPHATLPKVPGWSKVADTGLAWSPHYAGADLRLQQRYRARDGREVDLAIAVFAQQGEGRELVGFGQGAVPPGWIWTSPAAAPADARGERLTGSGGVVRVAQTLYRVGTMTTGSDRAAKLETIAVRLRGGPPGAAAVTLSSPEARGGQDAIAAFRHALGPIEPIADAARGR